MEVYYGFNDDSLDRHGVTHEECIEALADMLKVDEEQTESKQGNPRIMWVGMTRLDRLLEVGVEYLQDMEFIYHANSAQAKYRKLYNRSR
jgi:uncharacterized DUF497 family protein